MPLVPCPDCKKAVSDTSDACPKCGHRLTVAEIAKAKKQQKQAGMGCAVMVALPILFIIIGAQVRAPSQTTARDSFIAQPTKLQTVPKPSSLPAPSVLTSLPVRWRFEPMTVRGRSGWQRSQTDGSWFASYSLSLSPMTELSYLLESGSENRVEKLEFRCELHDRHLENAATAKYLAYLPQVSKTLGFNDATTAELTAAAKARKSVAIRANGLLAKIAWTPHQNGRGHDLCLFVAEDEAQ